VNGYRFLFPAEVRFNDLDGMGHVNNVIYLTYMEGARIAWWLHVTGRTGLGAVNMILARTEIDYRSPASFGESLEVGVRCASMRRSSFVLEFAIEETKARRLVAEARKVLVHYDYERAQPVPLTPELRARIRAQDPEVREDGSDAPH
jgi:acyl-CoA thioester hydrolase